MRTSLLLLLALLLLGALPASAKVSCVSPVPPAALAPAPPDTAAALHHLFERQRQLRRRMVLGAAGAGLLLAGIGVVGASHQKDGIAAGICYVFAILSGLIAGTIALVILAAYDRYSRLHERRALNLLGYHLLPADLARELEPEDFQAPPLP